MNKHGNMCSNCSGFTDAQRNWLGAKKRWPLGTVITYKYQNLTAKGVPRFPVFLRERMDKSWDDVVADAKKDAADAGKKSKLVRAPSLMIEAAVASPKAGLKRTSSLLFTDDEKVEAAAANPGPPSKKPKTEAAVRL